MKSDDLLDLGGRYFTLLLTGMFNLAVFYIIFTPLTVYPVFWYLSFLEPGTRLLEGNFIYFAGEFLEIIRACVAGAAYYLLLILNLTTPMKIDKRIKSILFIFGTFLFINILRIVIFAMIAVSGSQYFDVAHSLVWYFGSTVIVVGVWFANVWLFKIENIPIYSDAKNLFGDVIGKKDRPRDKKSHSSAAAASNEGVVGLKKKKTKNSKSR